MQAARKDRSDAQIHVAKMLWDGTEIPQNKSDALKWYEASSKLGNIDAKNTLGTLYLKGDTVPKDTQHGLELIIAAASEGHPAAFQNLGLIYQLGLGLPKNNVYAYLWFAVAANIGHQTAEKFKEGLAISMSPVDVEKAKKLAASCKQKNYKKCISF
jgi:hypothetical protein